ncbi:MAG TPA: hypothetical protein VM687_05310 [Stenotrophomonas sp.]|nr:hypothetical protein [Stenotrophomonas sp.]
MRISKQQQIAGAPAVLLRDAFKRLRDGGPWTRSDLAAVLGLEDVTSILATLRAEGFVEPDDRFVGEEPLYRLTADGGALANAKATAPIARATAERLLRGVVDRAGEMNARSDYLHYVREIRVFGSYLSDAQKLGDLDLVVQVEPRFEGEAYRVAHQAYIQKEEAEGRRFRDHLDLLLSPAQDFFRILRGNSNYVSLTTPDDDVLATATQCTVYTFDSDAPN